MNRWLALVFFIVVAFGGGFFVSMFTTPDEWYRALAKPWFNPPDWLFGVAWSILYILVGIAGWLVWQAGDRRAQVIWWVQLAINFCWTPVFFRLHQIGLALVVVVALLIAILGFIAATWRGNRPAALLFAPYALWAAFASLLTAFILAMN